jgi:hypothetical protein
MGKNWGSTAATAVIFVATVATFMAYGWAGGDPAWFLGLLGAVGLAGAGVIALILS